MKWDWGGGGGNGGRPILAIQKGSTSPERQQAFPVADWEWKEIWGWEGVMGELHIVNAQRFHLSISYAQCCIKVYGTMSLKSEQTET